MAPVPPDELLATLAAAFSAAVALRPGPVMPLPDVKASLALAIAVLRVQPSFMPLLMNANCCLTGRRAAVISRWGGISSRREVIPSSSQTQYTCTQRPSVAVLLTLRALAIERSDQSRRVCA